MAFRLSTRGTRDAARCVVCAVACAVSRAHAQTDLGPLGDEFENAGTLGTWSRVHVVEQWNAEQLETWDIDATTPGRMTMVPYTVTWFENWRGPYAFKTIGGDFVATTDVTSTARDGVSVPDALFSLGGILIRTPRAITPATWTPGGENYVFLSLGYGNVVPRTFQYEVKTTVNSASTLFLTPAPSSSARLQIARIGSAVITLRSEPGHPWVVHRRYTRADFPESMQVGLVAYTDWGKVQYFGAFTHNSTVLDPPLAGGIMDPRPDVPFHPDLISTFEYLRFHRPTVPAALVGRDLASPADVSDAELLAFLGDNASEPGPARVGPVVQGGGLELSVAPNPFVGSAAISFRLPRTGYVGVSVHDFAGRLVRSLDRRTLDRGDHLVKWDGRDARGTTVPAGVYLVSVEGAGENVVRKIVRVR